MPFLPPNQQRQSTEGTQESKELTCSSEDRVSQGTALSSETVVGSDDDGASGSWATLRGRGTGGGLPVTSTDRCGCGSGSEFSHVATPYILLANESAAAVVVVLRMCGSGGWAWAAFSDDVVSTCYYNRTITRFSIQTSSSKTPLLPHFALGLKAGPG